MVYCSDERKVLFYNDGHVESDQIQFDQLDDRQEVKPVNKMECDVEIL